MIWITNQIPELTNLSPWKRKLLIKAATRSPLHYAHLTLTVLAAIASIPAALSVQIPMDLVWPLMGIVLCLAYSPLSAWIIRIQLRHMLVNHKCQPFVCYACGYRLTANDQPACPECGWKVDPAKRMRGLVHPRIKFSIQFDAEPLLRFVAIVGCLVTFVMTMLAGAASMTAQHYPEKWDVEFMIPTGFFAGWSAGAFATIFVLVMLIHGFAFLIQRRGVAVLVCLATLGIALFLLCGVIMTNWDALIFRGTMSVTG
jgi:hypothetical protein